MPDAPADVDRLGQIAACLDDIRAAVIAPPAVLPLLLTFDDAARFSGLSRSHLYRLVSGGHLAAVSVPEGQPRLRRDDLIRFTERLRPTRGRRKSAAS